MSKRIVIMAGGTGGHVFPALAVAEALREKGHQVSWLGTQKGLESRIIPAQGIEIDWLAVAGVRGKGWRAKIKAAFLLIKACTQALKILRQRKPDLVLGMGGFVAGPGGLMAKLLGIPLIIHEQNRVVGTTNRLLAGMATQVLEAFPGSFKGKHKAKFTGNPLRKQFLVYQGVQRLKPLHFGINILVVGGSQGAQILNEIVPEAVAVWEQMNLQAQGSNKLQIMHQTGAVMQSQVKGRYQTLGVKADVYDFIEDMVSAYQWADIVICRSGAMTVSEVAAAGIPAIFIPLPNAIDDHQTANARYLTDAGSGLLLKQKDLTETTLAEQITTVITQWDVMSKTAKKHARLDATDVVVGICEAER